MNPQQQTDSSKDSSNESKYKKTYRGVLEISKSLDSIYKSSNAFLKIFQPETTLLRDRLRQYSETLIFRQPIEYGRKVEEILWRRVFYDIIHIVKMNKKSLKLNKELECMYRLHLSTAFGYYNQLILRLKQEFSSSLNLDGFLDFTLQSRDISSALFPSATSLKCDTASLKDFITKILHKFLICLGDLSRYQIDYEPMGCTKLSEKYYFMALMLIPENGMPLNQLGTLYSSQNYGCDSAFYYIYCLSCIHSFSGSKENLKLLFIKNRKRYEDLKHKKYDNVDKEEIDDLRELNAKRVKKFFVTFLYLIDLFLSDIIETSKVPANINNLQELCQICLQDFNTCLYFNDELKNSNEKLAFLPNDLVFKILLIILMTVERLKRHKNFNSQKTSASRNTILFTAIAFAFLMFSHILNHAIIRFEKDILNLTQNQEKTQEKHDECFQQTTVSQDSDSEVELSEDEKMKKIHLLFSRRRRRRNSDSDTESDDSDDSLKYSSRQSKMKNRALINRDEYLSEDNLSNFSEYNDRTEEESSNSELEKFEDPVQDTSQQNEGLKDYLSKLIPLNTESNDQTNPLSSNFREFSLQLSSTYLNYETNSQKTFDESNDFIDNELYKQVLAGKTQVSVPPGFEKNETEAKVIEEIGEKIAKFQIETDTEMSTVLSESEDSKSESSVIERAHHLNDKEITVIIETFSKQALLPSIKIFCDWLLCNRKLIQSISQVSQTIWSKLAVLLNCIPLEKEIANSNVCQNSFVQSLIFKTFETIHWNTHPIFEDIQTRSFDALKSEHIILKYDLNNLSKLTHNEETFIRLCCLRRFGYLLASLSQSQTMNIFSYDAVKEQFIAIVKEQEAVQQQQKVDDKDRKFRFMKDLAQLRLQSEISQLETTFKSSLSPYIVPDANSLCHNLKLVQELSRANKFIIIIPLVVIDTLDAMKKDSQFAREAIRWLENQFKQGNRFIRAQIHNEKLSNNRQQTLKSKDIDSWRLYQLIDCCKYFKQQFEVSKNIQSETSITQMVTLLINHNLNETNCNERLKNLIQSANSEQIEVKNIKEFYDKWKSTS